MGLGHSWGRWRLGSYLRSGTLGGLARLRDTAGGDKLIFLSHLLLLPPLQGTPAVAQTVQPIGQYRPQTCMSTLQLCTECRVRSPSFPECSPARWLYSH